MGKLGKFNFVTWQESANLKVPRSIFTKLIIIQAKFFKIGKAVQILQCIELIEAHIQLNSLISILIHQVGRYFLQKLIDTAELECVLINEAFRSVEQER